MVQVSLLKVAALGSAILTVHGIKDTSNKNVAHREQQQPAARAMQVEEEKAARGTTNQVRNLRFNIPTTSTTDNMMTQNSNTFDTYNNVDHSTYYDTYDDKTTYNTEKTYYNDNNYDYSVSSSNKICLTEDDCRAQCRKNGISEDKFYRGDNFPEIGCFTKNGIYFWGDGPDAAKGKTCSGIRKRVWCDDYLDNWKGDNWQKDGWNGDEYDKPTLSPTLAPTLTPTGTAWKSDEWDKDGWEDDGHTDKPTLSPSLAPTLAPSMSPTWSPTLTPTGTAWKSDAWDKDGWEDDGHTDKPTLSPTLSPSFYPTLAPVWKGDAHDWTDDGWDDDGWDVDGHL